MEDLESLLQLLKQRGYPTYSDTPGMGNVEPYQFPGTNLPREMNYSNKVNPGLDSIIGLSTKMKKMKERKMLEQLLMEQQLSATLKTMKELKEKGPHGYQMPSGGNWDYIEPTWFKGKRM